MKLTKKQCGNCKHLFITGMFKSWGGTAGYCLLIKKDKNNDQTKNENGIPKAQIESIKQISDCCAEFQRREN
jgi:hypothetical protein